MTIFPLYRPRPLLTPTYQFWSNQMYLTSFVYVFISNDIRKYNRTWKNVVFEIFFKKIGFFGLFSGGPGILKITQKLPKIIKNRKKKKFWVFFFDQLRVYLVFFWVFMTVFTRISKFSYILGTTTWLKALIEGSKRCQLQVSEC